MTTLKAEKRSMDVKAKRLRREGPKITYKNCDCKNPNKEFLQSKTELVLK